MMDKVRTALLNTVAVALVLLLWGGVSGAAVIGLSSSTTDVKPGEDVAVDVVVDGIPQEGLNCVRFKLNIDAPGVQVVGVQDLAQAPEDAVSVSTPILMGPPSAMRSGLGQFFYAGAGPSGVLALENEQLASGSATITFAHTYGATRPVGGGPVARIMVHVGSSVDAENFRLYLTDVALLDGGIEYELTDNQDLMVQLRCLTNVPNLAGMTPQESHAALNAAGLIAGDVYEIYNDGSMPLGKVLEQSIGAGERVLCESTVNFAVNIAPDEVTQLTSSDKQGDESGTAIISWNPSVSPDTAGYRVYGPSGGSYVLLGTLAGRLVSSYEVSGLVDGVGKSFNVTAYDTFGNESAGVTVAAMSEDDVPPSAAITGVTAGAYYNIDVLPAAETSDAHISDISWTLNGEPFEPAILTDEGDYVLVLTVKDAAGNTTTDSKSFVIDKTPPAIIFAGVTDGAFYNSDISPQITIDEAHPDTSGTMLNGESYEGGPVSAEGAYSLSVSAKDLAGNTTSLELGFVIDKTVPESSIVIGDPVLEEEGNAYVTGATGITLQSADVGAVTSGISSAMYRIDQAEDWTVPVGEFNLDGMADGAHSLYYRAVDVAGNVEPPKERVLTVDNTAPETVFEAGLPKYTGGEDTYITSGSKLSLIATDELSGVSSTEYRLDGTGWTQYSQFSIPDEGTHTIEYSSTDSLGNAETSASSSVIVDDTPPEASIAFSGRTFMSDDGSFYVSGTSAVLLAANDGLSGVNRIEYRMDGGDWKLYETLTVNDDGNHTIEYRAFDNLGNVSSVTSKDMITDGTAPSTEITTVGSAYSAEDGVVFVTGQTGFMLAAADNISGVATTEYRIDDSDWEIYTQFTVTAEGAHTVQYRSADKLGNIEAAGKLSIVVDDTAPTTTITASDPKFTADDGSLYVTPSTGFELTYTDNSSGIALSEYRVDSGPWTVYAPFNVSAEGEHVIEYRSTDNVGNVEVAGTITATVDDTEPVTDITVGSPRYSSSDDKLYVSGSSVFTLVPADNLSGIASTEYRVDDADWVAYAPFSVKEEGAHKIEYRSSDNLGHTEAAAPLEIIVDNTSPASVLSVGEPEYADAEGTRYVTRKTQFVLSANDGLSGTASLEYRLDDGEWTAYEPFALDTDGMHAVEYRSSDNVGNVETARTIKFVVDNTGPVTVISAGEPRYESGDGDLFVTSDSLFTLSSSDDLSGPGTMEYRLDGGEWTVYAPFRIPGEGEHAIECRGVDNLGNTGEVGTLKAVVDNSPPVSSYSFETHSYLDGERICLSEDSIITIKATDDLSGVAAIYYGLDDGERVKYVEKFSLAGMDSGNHVLHFYSSDNLGNTEIEWSVPLTLISVDVQTSILSVPRVLIYTGVPAKKDLQDEQRDWMRGFVDSALGNHDAYYSLVFDKDEFVDAFRSGIYNTYVIIDQSAPFNDLFISELKEAVNSSAGLLVSGWGNNVKEHMEDVLGVSFSGSKSNFKDTLTLRLSDSPVSAGQDLLCYGRPVGIELAGGTLAGILSTDASANPILCVSIGYSCAVEKGDLIEMTLSNADGIIDREVLTVDRLPARGRIPDTIGSLAGNLSITGISPTGIECQLKPSGTEQDYNYSLDVTLTRSGIVAEHAEATVNVSPESALDAGMKAGDFDVVSVDRMIANKPLPDKPGVVLNEYGGGRTVFMSFNLADAAQAGEEEAYAELLANCIFHVLPQGEGIGPEKLLLLDTGITIHGAGMDVVADETLDEGPVYTPLFGLDKELPLEYQLSLEDGVPCHYRYFVRTPDKSGSYAKNTDIRVSFPGDIEYYGRFTHYIDVEEDSIVMSNQLIEMFKSLQSKNPESADAISEWTGDFENMLLMPEITRADVDKKIHCLVMLLRRLGQFNIDTAEERLLLDRYIGILQAEYSIGE